jgi:hypothetical protein
VPDVFTLVVTPTTATRCTELATLPGQLIHDARVTGSGWVIVADNRFAELARSWRAEAEGQFRSVTVIDRRNLAATLAAAAGLLPAPLAAPLRLPT